MARLRLPMTDPRAPSTYPGLNLNVNVQPNVLLPDNQAIVASPVIVAYSQQPVLAAASSPSPALSAVIESPVSPFAPPLLRTPQQSTFPVDREVNQSVFETPRAVETLYALQTIEDNVDGVHPEGKRKKRVCHVWSITPYLSVTLVLSAITHPHSPVP
ncbi:hypothetical protein GGH92_001989 [Coemansia sp. RSA 2673]|nr:hypothetical protein GGH92_001989 [Coemansia sp. RSA 2673]